MNIANRIVGVFGHVVDALEHRNAGRFGSSRIAIDRAIEVALFGDVKPIPLTEEQREKLQREIEKAREEVGEAGYGWHQDEFGVGGWQ